MKRLLFSKYMLPCLCLLLVSLSSCTWGKTRATVQAPKENEITASEPGTGNGQRSVAPDGATEFTSKTEILTIGSRSVRWPEFYFWLKFIEKHYRKFYRIDKISDWNNRQNGLPLKSFFLSSAVGYACQERAIEAKAREIGIELSSADEANIAQVKQGHEKVYGRTEYLRMIRREYVTDEVFAYLSRMDHLGKRLFAHLYGEKGETCPEKNVSACRKLFRSQVEGWCAELEITYTEAYHMIDPELLFK